VTRVVSLCVQMSMSQQGSGSIVALDAECSAVALCVRSSFLVAAGPIAVVVVVVVQQSIEVGNVVE
jgi:hypothetical protein